MTKSFTHSLIPLTYTVAYLGASDIIFSSSRYTLQCGWEWALYWPYISIETCIEEIGQKQSNCCYMHSAYNTYTRLREEVNNRFDS